jgi:hypothetical protein
MPDERGVLTHTEVLHTLSEMAIDGSVTAAVQLERVLRPHQQAADELDRAIEQLLADD